MNRAQAYAKQKSRRKSYKSLDAGAETAFDEHPENFILTAQLEDKHKKCF